MRSFLINLTKFLFGLFILNLLYFYFVFNPAIFDKYIFNEASIDEYNLFLVSDSHGEYIADVPSKNKIFNFSNTSENYLDMYLKIQYLTSKLSKKDTILLAIDNHNLSSYRNGFGRIEENIIYTNDLSGIEKSAIKKYYYIKPFLKFLPILQPVYNDNILKYLKYLSNKNSKIINYSKKSEDEKIKLIEERYKQQFDNKVQSIQQKYYLDKIIQLCKKKNITLIGLKFPISKQYWDVIDDNDFGITNYWLSNGLRIIDLHAIFFQNDEYFADVDHLNINGGQVFCNEIHKCLKQNNFVIKKDQ